MRPCYPARQAHLTGTAIALSRPAIGHAIAEEDGGAIKKPLESGFFYGTDRNQSLRPVIVN
jgi:hypothetical protein